MGGTATGYTDTTAAYNTQYYYEVFSGAPGWASAVDVDMALSLPPTGGTDDTSGTGGTAFTAANLAAMSVAGGVTYTTAYQWGGGGAQIMGNAQIFGVSCVNTSQCWAVGQGGAIWYTSNFGTTWTEEVTPPPANRNLFGVDMVNSQHGFIVGEHGYIYYTSNGEAPGRRNRHPPTTSSTR